jgi:hypothetical protein
VAHRASLRKLANCERGSGILLKSRFYELSDHFT